MSSPVTVLGFNDIVPTSCAVKIVNDGDIAKQVEGGRGCLVLWSDQIEVQIGRDWSRLIVCNTSYLCSWVPVTRCLSFAFAKQQTKRWSHCERSRSKKREKPTLNRKTRRRRKRYELAGDSVLCFLVMLNSSFSFVDGNRVEFQLVVCRF